MNISEKIMHLRKNSAMSQDDLAEKLDVSRQAISRWENGTALPDAGNILALSKLFNVTTDYLLNDDYESDEDLPKVKESKSILHTNLTQIAIIVQACFLNATVQPWDGAGEDRALEMAVKLIPLLAASIWMASNHRFEKDRIQRAKNTKIELLYCLCQATIAVVGYLHHWGGWATLLLLAVLFYYIFVINPKYMNRRLVEKKR